MHERFQLSVGLDAFGDDLDVERSHEADCRSDDRRAAVIVRQTVHELLHDLDSADTDRSAKFEGRAPGAKVVDRSSQPERS